jgi:hypothetical protein
MEGIMVKLILLIAAIVFLCTVDVLAGGPWIESTYEAPTFVISNAL